MSVNARLIHQAYRFALRPTAKQEEFLVSCCGASRFWFNQGLALVKDRLDRRAGGEDVSVPWSYKGLCSEFAPLKDSVCPWRSEVVVGSMQAGLEQLGCALQNHSKGKQAGRLVGFPRFRAKGRCHESVIFQRPHLADTTHVVLDRRLGPLRTKESMRKLILVLEGDERARVPRSTVQRRNGAWLISFTVERSKKARRARRPDTVVGVDLGPARLATLSTGEVAANSRPLQGILCKLRRMQRRLDRQRRAANPGNYLPGGCVRPGPKTWRKSARMARTEHRIRRLHRRAADVRREQAHQLTTYLTREFGVIGVETLAVKNLLVNRRLSRQISDVGWGSILHQLAYKTSWSHGSRLIAADRFYPSSKMCSACGVVKAKLGLAERIFTCEVCGLVRDRDLNAALNLAHVAQRHAQAGGVPCHVAAAGAETQNARRGHLRPGRRPGLDPVKREGLQGSSPRRKAQATH